MNTALTWSQTLGVLGRNPIFAAHLGVDYSGAIPEEGKLLPDSVYGCVLFYRKTDGSLLAIQTDAFKDCKMTQVPGVVQQILGEIPNPINLAADIARWTRNVGIALIVILGLILALQSGIFRRLRS